MDENESRSGAGAARRAIRRKVWGIMIIVGVIIRSFTRYARNTQEVREVPEVPPITMIENTIADSTVENTGNDTAENTIAHNITEIDGNVVRAHMPMIPDMIKIGDTRETMIEAMGEPEEIWESQENPDCEEALYSSSGFGDWLVVVVENDVITDIYVEYTMEDKGE